MDLLTLEDRYLKHLASTSCSPKTIKTYRSVFRQVWRTMEELGVALHTGALDKLWARTQVEWWREVQGLSAATVHRNVGALRGLFKFAQYHDLMDRDPFIHVQLPEKGETDRPLLSEGELNRLVEAAGTKRGTDGRKWVRDPRFVVMVQALLLTQFAVGTRISELLKLTPEDLNFEQKVVRLRLAKGGKSREVPMGERTEAALREWLQVRRLLLATREGDRRIVGREPAALWLADRGRSLSADAVSAILDDVCFGAGIDQRVRVHDLRAMTAQRWKREGVPIEVISAWLGHADVAQTKRYVRDACADTRQYAHFCDLPEVGSREQSKVAGATPGAAESHPRPTQLEPTGGALVSDLPGEPVRAGTMAEMLQAFEELQRLHQRFPVLQQMVRATTPGPQALPPAGPYGVQ